MARLTILRGISGSGKSTWAESQAGHPVIVSRDRLRVAFYGSDGQDYYSVPREVLNKREDFITKAEHGAITSALRLGHHVISDNTNVQMKYVNALAKIAYSLGAEVDVKVFDVDLRTALYRNDLRARGGGRRVPDEAIRKQHDQLAGTKDKPLPERPVIRPYTGTPGKPKAFMVDIDGTLAHMNGKRGPFDWKNVVVDDVDFVVAEVVNILVYGSGVDDGLLPTVEPYNAIIMSGRDEESREDTELWLSDKQIGYTDLFMRPKGDMRPDNIVKAELFDTHVRDNFDVQFVIDDRWQVCQMWLTMGLKVFNVSGLDRGEF